jgi:hypothetical protein
MNFAARWFAIAALLGCCALATAGSNETREESLPLDGHALQSDLSPINNLRLHLRDGDYRIVASDSDDITIRTDGKNREGAKKVKVLLKRSGDSLDITLTHVPKNECKVTIEVPRETNLYARMRAGDLSVDGVTGNKDLELLAGDITIQGTDSAEYGPVDLSVKFGDVHGEQFGSPKGVVGNSLRHDGNGRYRLHAHVFAGDLTLRP